MKLGQMHRQYELEPIFWLTEGRNQLAEEDLRHQASLLNQNLISFTRSLFLVSHHLVVLLLCRFCDILSLARKLFRQYPNF